MPKPKYIPTEITYGKKHKEKASTTYTNVVADFLYFARFIADLPKLCIVVLSWICLSVKTGFCLHK